MKMRVLGLAAVATAFAATPALAKDYVYATFVPPKHGIVIHAIEPMIDEIKKATSGAISFQLKAGAQLFGPETSFSSVGDGVADVTTGIPSYTPALVPRQNLIAELQMFTSDVLAGGAAHIDTMINDCPDCQNEFKKIGAIVLAGYSTGPNVLFCNKQVKTLADVKGKKIRAAGGQGRLAQAMGGTPVRMAVSDMPSALERGQVDCVIGPMSWIKSYSVLDYIKSVYYYPMGGYPAASLVLMNLKTWKGFTPEHRKALMPIFARGMARAIVDGYVKYEDEAEAEVRAKNVPINKAEPAMDEVMKKLLGGEITTAVEGAKRFNVDNGDKIADVFLKNYAKWQKLLEGVPVTSAAFEKVLWDNLYSKLDPEKL